MKIHPVVTCDFGLDGGAMFGVVPKPLWSRDTEADEKNRIPMVTRAILVDTKERVVLIDTGIGEDRDEKFKSIYGIRQRNGGISGVLKNLGYAEEDIDDIIITQLHFDHAGGCTKILENGSWTPRFPAARYHVQEKQWRWAHSPTPRDRASFISTDFDPIEEKGQLILHNGSYDLVEGIRVEVTEGHTPGHQVVIIQTDDTTYLYPGDTIPMSFHVRIPYIMGYDLEPLKTLKEKTELLEKAASSNWKILFEHDPKIECATVHFEGKRPIVEPEKI